MNSGVKDRVAEFLPVDLLPKIATEKEVQDINALRSGSSDGSNLGRYGS